MRLRAGENTSSSNWLDFGKSGYRQSFRLRKPGGLDGKCHTLSRPPPPKGSKIEKIIRDIDFQMFSILY